MDIFEEIKKLTLPKTNQLPPSQIPQPTTNKGLEAINQIRSSIRPTSFKPLSETSQFRPLSEARPLTTPLPAIRPTPKPQLRDLTRETIPTTFGTFKPVISPIIKQTPTPQLFKPTTLKSADISQQPIYRLAKFSQRPIAVEKIKRTAEKVSKSFSKVFDSSDKITATERLLEGLSGVGAVLSLPNEIAIQPIYDSLKLGYKGLRTGQITDQDIEDYFYTIGGEKGTIFDAIGTNEQEFGKKYGDNLLLLARFLDFAPELIDLPTGRAKNVATFARKVKIPQEAIEEAGKLAKQDEVIKAIANFEAQTGEKISKQAKDLITKTVDNPKNFINTLSKEAKQKAIVPQIDETTKYIKELVERQKRAKAIETPNILQRLGQIAREVDVKLQDFTTPINQAVNKAIKEGKIISPSKNPIFQIDRVLRADSIASQFVKDEGLAKIIQNVDNLDEFNQYLIAKSVAELSKIRPDVKTGRDLVRDAKLIKDLDAKYNDFAEQIFNYNQKVLKLGRNSGIISGDLYKTLTESRLKYVPLQRIFNEIEEVAAGVTPRAVASLGKQTIVQRLKGSEREIANPLESMLTNTYKAVAQSERNIAAQQIANLVKEKAIPGKLLDKGEKFNSNEVISYFDNGKLERVFVGKDLARAAKYLNKENTNFLVNILKIPTRILQVGAVGLNLPFVISNLVRDQATAAIVSGKPFRNTILNPVGFGKALFQSYGEGKVYDDFIRAGAGFSSIDLTRDTAKTIKQLRDEANPFIKGAKTITNPVELFKAVEEFISKAETTTRLQVFTTTREDLLRRGISAENAEILAADAARNVTANFARRGEFGTVLNAVIPFFNATIQGARTLRNSFVNNPVRTTALFGATVAVPTTVTTLWNISEPERKKVYDQIPDYEKERNFIVIPPVVTYDDRGYPFYFRIPKPQGYNQLADPVRRLLEVSYESIPDAVTSITNNILGSTTGYTIPFNEQGARQLTSQFTPQIIRPAIEASTGVNLFTGQRIIPRGLENLPPEEQVKETTSFTARQIGKNLGVSPLLVENTIKTSGAGVGEQLLNISDRAAAFATGQVPQEQIGGRDPFESVVNVFYRASGGADVGRIYDQLEKIDQEKALLNLKVKDMILKNDISGLQSITPNLTKQQFNALETSITEKEFAKTLSPQDRALFNATNSQLDALRNLNTGLGSRIDEILIIKESFKDRKKIDTKNFIFKDSQTKTKKIKLPTIKKPRKVRIPKPKKPKLKLAKVRIKKPKKRKTIKLQTRI